MDAYDQALPAGVARSRALDMAVERAYATPARLAEALARRVAAAAVDEPETEPSKRYTLSVSETTVSRLEVLAENADLPIEIVFRLVVEAHLWDLQHRESRKQLLFPIQVDSPAA
jgi:hypothetical protein